MFLSCIESRLDDPTNLYARFKIGPFEKNQTLTIANNLRRALLSELDGIAIVAVKIQGVKHEYSSLPGVRESVLDILLNIKKIVIASDCQLSDVHMGFLQASGPGIVKAGQIKLPPFLKCIDPEQPIANLCNDGKFNIVFLICPGKNYWMHSLSRQTIQYCSRVFQKSEFTKANILPIDAVFMPIKRVNYTIETDEEIDTEYPTEHIFLEIWTNGSIHPVQAIEKAATCFIDLFQPFQNLQSCKPKFVSLTNVTSDAKKVPGVEDNVNPSSVLDLDIGNLDLSLRPYTCLKTQNIQNVRDILQLSREELLLIQNFGKKSLEEVENSLYKLGFFLPIKNQSKK